MSQKKSTFLLGLLMCAVLFGCDLQTDKIVQNQGSAILSINVDALTVGLASGSRGETIITTGLSEDVVKVVVNITGINIPSPIEYELVNVNGVWQGIIGNIPAGPATVVAHGYDSAGTLIYQTSANITVDNHQKLTLNLTLQPTTPPPGYNVKAPRIDLVNISPQKVAPNDPVYLSVVAHDPEPSGPLTYVWTPSNVGKFNDRTLQNPTWTAPSVEGYYQLTITVIDEEFLLDHFTFTIEVNYKYGAGNVQVTLGSNNYPVIVSITADPTRIDKGGSTHLVVDAYDPDDNPLTYTWHADCPGVFSDTTVADPVFTVDTNVEYGVCKLSVDVSDGSLTSTGSIVINISSDPTVNVAPVVMSAFQSDDKVSPNGKLTFIIKAQDPEATPVQFTWSTDGLGTFGSQTNTKVGADYQSQIVWTAPSSGSGTVKISVMVKDADGLAIQYNFLPVTLK